MCVINRMVVLKVSIFTNVASTQATTYAGIVMGQG